jgi:hypothetical protein
MNFVRAKMKLTDRFLNWLDSLGRKRIIMDRLCDEPYLERYYLFLKDRDSFPFNVFLHKFLKGDPDDVHDHPWSYFTLILRGGYYEWIPFFNEMGEMTCEVQKWRGPGHFRVCKPNSYHRIELKPGVTAWTLFMPFKKVRDWGFLVNNVWIQNEYYLKTRKTQNEQAQN